MDHWGQDQKAFAQVIAKAWADEGFKSRLLAEPAQVLREEGITVPAGVEVRIVENTEKLVHFVLPAQPSDELSEEQVEKVAAGLCCVRCLSHIELCI